MPSGIVEVKPLSVNTAWKGRRFKTQDYEEFERELLVRLPASISIPSGPLALFLEWGFSNAASDWDNPIKPMQDVLQKKSKQFNDKTVFLGLVEKKLVPKGKEYVGFRFLPYATVAEQLLKMKF